jgi:hypothetical protein
MRTRTLLLLAVVCGVIILVAGGIQLVRLADQKQTSVQLDIDQAGQAGDAVVTLRGTDVVDDAAVGERTVVTVDIGGVADPSGLGGFTLVGVGVVARVDPSASTCAGIAEIERRCELAFDTSSFPSGARQLLFRRADTQLRWVLRTG